jgi:putative hydrolase of the HAD superfamily
MTDSVGRRDAPSGRVGEAAPSQFDAVFFDFGGVLIDSPLDAFTEVERRNGLPEGFIRSVNAANHLDNAWARFERGALSFDEFVAAFGDETAAAGARVDAREIFGALTGQVRPAMVEALRRVHQRWRTGLLTNNFPVPLTDAGYDEILAMFDVVVASADVGIRKPDPRFYELACERLGVAPSRVVFLDDLGVNLKPARELGMVTIKVTDVEEAVGELEQVLGVPLR